jgi:tetratricopeptide (TPR) repeat protein
MLNLVACAGNSTKPTDRAGPANAAAKAPDSSAAMQQLVDALTLIADHNYTQGEMALQTVISAPTFSSLSVDDRYQALSTAGKVGIEHGQVKLGYDYLVRALAMPQSDYEDRLMQLSAANKLGYTSDALAGLAILVQRWPDRVNALNPYFVVNILRKARQLPPSSALPAFRALYNAHWKGKSGEEPSGMWREFVLLLLEDRKLAEAIDVSARVTDADDLIDMRADRRYDAVVAANPLRFDIDVAAERELREMQSLSENSPRSLVLKTNVIELLRHQQHYAAALAAADSLVVELRSTNYPEKIYADYGEQISWFLNERATVLERVGRWDDAVAQLSAAGVLLENNIGNVSQLINLGDLYCRLDRPKDALAAVNRLVAHPSPFGVMEMEQVRLDAAVQLQDSKEAARSLQYLREHRTDAPTGYQYALIIVNQLDLAAQVLIARLLDPEQRTNALASAQSYAEPPTTPRDMELRARWRAVIARQDVQAAIQKVGRVESYHLEAQDW